MQLFCDHCGTEFTPKVLRAESRFCSCCGKPLSEYIKEHAFENAFRSRGLLPSPDDQINESFVKREVKKRKNRESPDDKELMLSPARSTPIRMRTRQRELIPNGDSGRSDAALDTSTEDTEVAFPQFNFGTNICNRVLERESGFVNRHSVILTNTLRVSAIGIVRRELPISQSCL